jgi:predicted O-linked N-acetylglucosamine transferase (SPINDLY family)
LADDRVELLTRTPDTVSHLALYGRVDVALDTFPYNGTTTTCEALWMGVPVITLAGDRHAARVGQSLLTAVGHPEWVAPSVEAYVEQAVALGSEAGRLASLRKSLRGELANSVLFDHAGQATRFGHALRECWRHWCAPVATAARPEPALATLTPA